jgi:kynurenine formamidase
MGRKLIDLSMEVSNDMVTFPRVARPIMAVLETHEEFATNVGAAEHGVTSLTAHCAVVLSDHAGTHVDSMRHMVPGAPSAGEIPLEYCYGDGVVLDFTHLPYGAGITVKDVEEALAKISYTLKPLDIVMLKTGASRYNKEQRYLTDHCGMTKEATHCLIDKGIIMMGTDAVTFDPPVKTMLETKKLWEAHQVMLEKEYYHLENLENLDAIPVAHGFTVSVLPVKWMGTTGSPVRAVAIIEE